MNSLCSSKHYGIFIKTAPNESREDCLKRLKRHISLPCGNFPAFAMDFNDIPLDDVPCPCGDPDHYILKWIDEW